MSNNSDQSTINFLSFNGLLQSLREKFKLKSNETINIPEETGWDRIKNIFVSFHQGKDSMEIKMITTSFQMGGFFGMTLGALIKNRQVFENFTRQHNTNVFRGHFEANRKLNDTIYIELIRRSVKYAIRYGLFTGTFVTTLTLFTTYRNDVYYRDCALSGALTGIVWKAHLGTRAVLVNSVIGSLFGLTFALLIKMVMKLTDTSIKQMREEHSYNIKDNIGGSIID